MSKDSCPVLFSKSVCTIGHDFLDKQYQDLSFLILIGQKVKINYCLYEMVQLFPLTAMPPTTFSNPPNQFTTEEYKTHGTYIKLDCYSKHAARMK